MHEPDAERAVADLALEGDPLAVGGPSDVADRRVSVSQHRAPLAGGHGGDVNAAKVEARSAVGDSRSIRRPGRPGFLAAAQEPDLPCGERLDRYAVPRLDEDLLAV